MSTLETSKPTVKPTRLLVRAPNWVGDAVMATPAFRALRAKFAGAHVTAVVNRNVRPVLEDSPCFDAFFEVGPRDKGLFGTLRAAKRMRRDRYDLGVLFTNSFRTALVMWLGRVKGRVGYGREMRGFLLTERLEPRQEHGRYVPAPMVDYYLGICGYLGCDVSDRRLELHYRPALERELDAYSRRRGIDWSRRVVLLNPGSSFGASKCWPVEHFARAAERLCEEKDVQAVAICAPDERDLAKAIALEAHCAVVSLHEEPAGLDLLKPLVRRAALLVTNDTGPRHYAAAFGTPVVTIFGATDPRWSDTGFEKEAAVSVKVDCAPCQRPRCRTDHRCMRWVTPEMVVEAARKLLKQFPKRTG
jgi:heptosyltransferase-2